MGTMEPAPRVGGDRSFRGLLRWEVALVAVVAAAIGLAVGRAGRRQPTTITLPPAGVIQSFQTPSSTTNGVSFVQEPRPALAQSVVPQPAAPQPAVGASGVPPPRSVVEPSPAADSATFAPGMEPGAENPGVKIEDLVLKTPDYAGDVWFSADVRNTLPQVAKIRLQAKAYSSSGELLDSKTFFPDPIDLPAFGHGTFSTYVSAKGKEISRVVVVPINR